MATYKDDNHLLTELQLQYCGCVCITHPGVSLSVDLDLDCFVFKYITTIAIYSFSGTIFTHSVSTFPERLSGPENEAK